MFNKSYSIAGAERQNTERKNISEKINVRLLDESLETFNINTSTNGQALFNAVCDCLEILERDYFGLIYKDQDKKKNTTVQKWLKMNKSIKKQLKGETTLHFRMRFVPSDITQIQEAYTRYQLFLQIKGDVLSNKMTCQRDLSVQMAAYSLQSELGDYNNNQYNIAEFRFVPDQNSSFISDVIPYYESLRGLRSEDAELKFLTVARSLPHYGSDLYSASLNDVKTQFGFCAQGVTVFPPSLKGAYIVPWNSVDKVLKKGKSFIVKILLNRPVVAMVEDGPDFSLHKGNKVDMSMIHQKMNSNLTFVLSCELAAKEAWAACIETHSFFRVHDSEVLAGSLGVGRSRSFFKLSSVAQLFTGRRTLHEVQDIRRRSRRIERNFIRTPSKRYNRKSFHQSERASNVVYGKQSSFGASNDSNRMNMLKKESKLATQKEIPKNTAINSATESKSSSEDEDDSDEEEPSRNILNIRNKANITQSVRLPRSNNPRLFQRTAASHSSLPRGNGYNTSQNVSGKASPEQKECFEDKSPDVLSKSFTRESSNRKFRNINEKEIVSGTNVHDLKGSGRRGPTSSNPLLNQSADRILDPDIVVELEMRAQDGRYGFTMRGGCDQEVGNRHIIVTRVTRGSPADLCNPRLCEGDQIIKINERSTENCTNAQIKEIIRTSGQRKDGRGLLTMCVKQRLYFGEANEDYSGTENNHDVILNNRHESLTINGSLTDYASGMKSLEESLINGSAVCEFEKLYKQKQGLSMDDAKKPENLYKNRYKDILPYDQTRVKIRNGEYINANFIKVNVSKNQTLWYIAGQGPLKHTAFDFLQMIWDHQVGLVVMVTELQERGRVKCYKYWPSVGESVKFHQNQGNSLNSSSGSLNCSVICESESVRNHVAIRKLRLKRSNSSETRIFYHIQYLNWPDHDVPSDIEEFEDFVQLMRQHRSDTGESQPVLVHCSAGIGRTGVVITMDIAMSYMNMKQPFSVLSIVRNIRNQRAMLIQSKKQYEFVCKAILSYYSKNYKS